MALICACGDPRDPVGGARPEPAASAPRAPATATARPRPIAIGMSSRTTIVLLDDGTLRAWGNGHFGLLGSGVGPDSVVPLRVPGIRDATALAVSANAPIACARLRSGSWTCWGETEYLPAGKEGVQPPTIEPAFDGAVDVRLSMFASCIVRSNGRVACWGRIPPADRVKSTPTPLHDLAGLENVIALRGDDPLCALERDGTVWCWGADDVGQASGLARLGGGDHVVATPTKIPGVSNAVELEATVAAVCARLKAGGLACWGRPFTGGVVSVPSPDDAHLLDAQRIDVCEVVSGRPARCLGTTPPEACTGGRDKTANEHCFRAHDEPGWDTLAIEPPTALATDYHGGCEITGAGDVRCWGENDLGQLGDGTLIARDTSAVVAALVDPIAPTAPPAIATAPLARAPAWAARPAACAYDATLDFKHIDVPGPFAVVAAFARNEDPAGLNAIDLAFYDHLVDPHEVAHPPVLVADQRAIRLVINNKGWSRIGPGRFAMGPRDAAHQAAMVVQTAHVYDDSSDDRAGMSGTVTLSHLDAQWGCGSLDLHGPGGHLRGRFAAELVAQ